jgi:hypothetical protein
MVHLSGKSIFSPILSKKLSGDPLTHAIGIFTDVYFSVTFGFQSRTYRLSKFKRLNMEGINVKITSCFLTLHRAF